jgi:WD40 repeat protein/serine/threonine protein kinase
MADRVGQQLGNYRLIRLLGHGGFAEVYLGEHTRLGTQAAIKVLLGELAEEEAEGFLREAKTIAMLAHPHIVHLLDYRLHEGTPFLVMDYAANGTLRQRHPKGSVVPLETVRGYVRQMADALQYAHEHRLIHRDIKPENMLLDRRDTVLLSDFGIAVVTQSSRYENPQEVIGTVAYMAPEQIQAHPRPASDQYSLGVVVYEWLCGERPFQGVMAEVATKHLLAPPPPLREKQPTISAAVEEVVLTTLAKDPRGRFGSMRAFANAFEQACKEDALLSAPTSSFSASFSGAVPVTPPTPSGPQMTPVLPLITPALPITDEAQPTVVRAPPDLTQPTAIPTPAGGDTGAAPSVPAEPAQTAAIPTALARPAPAGGDAGAPPPAPAGEKQARQKPERTQRRVSRRKVLAVSLSLAGVVAAGGGALTWLALTHQLPTWLATMLPAGLSNATPVRLTPQPSPSATPVPIGTLLYTYTAHTDWVNAVCWSPDGQYIASGSRDNSVQVWETTTGVLAREHPHNASVLAVAWAPDGTRIASGGQDYGVQVWSALGSGPTVAYTGHLDAVTSLAWSPDSTHIASASDDYTVQVWSASNPGQGSAINYNRHTQAVNSVAWAPSATALIASASADQTIQIWDPLTGASVHSYHDPNQAGVTSVAWSPDGASVLSGDAVGVAETWLLSSGQAALTKKGAANAITSVAWSPDGKYIAAAGAYPQGIVSVWDAITGASTYVYTGHNGEVRTIAWSPDSTRIASGGVDGTVQVWQAVAL